MSTGRRAEAWAVRNPAMHPWRSSAAISLARVGDRDSAIGLAEEEIALARRWGAPRAIGVALRAAGIAHGGEHGLALLRDAVAVLASSSAPLEHARALTDLGAALRRAGRRAEAREHLRAGLHLAHQLGPARGGSRREELTIAGGRPRRDALKGRDTLTSRASCELLNSQPRAGRTARSLSICSSPYARLRPTSPAPTESLTSLLGTSSPTHSRPRQLSRHRRRRPAGRGYE